MGKVGPVATITLAGLPCDATCKLELGVEVGGSTAELAGRCGRFRGRAGIAASPVPVRSRVKWAGIARRYPFVAIGSAAELRRDEGLLLTPTLDDEALAHLRAGGRVWLMTERGSTPVATASASSLLPGARSGR